MLEELRDINYKQKYRASSQLKDAAEKASDERDKSVLTIIGGALSLGYNHSECNYRPLIQLSDGRRLTRILFLRSSPLWMNVLAQTFEI